MCDRLPKGTCSTPEDTGRRDTYRGASGNQADKTWSHRLKEESEGANTPNHNVRGLIYYADSCGHK